MSRRQRRSRSEEARTFRCNACERGDCPNCIDVMKAALGLPTTCTCTRKGHTGEVGDRNDNDEVANDLVVRKMEEQFRE